ncbi:hypothetical protein [Antarcticimicrobium sediminis]|uniref:Uncharacterized protein n=1 Tax=Antarcticimicrobium sediminis TaxID=2546227 RepID=A0A4R5EIK4_9RHOB|nr:hypothetical protein [Antarcticimicrobium sediminis]TDE34248.1 hypothetical protein E1B25_20130 [Antarcticimicrobium sediminis]
MTDPISPQDRPKKTLVFHIGDRKTGSTSIQLAFAQGQVSLKGHSLFYPSKLAANALGTQCTTYGDANTPQMRRQAAKPLQKLADQVRRSEADFIVISAEAIEGVKVELFHDVVQTFFADTADDIRVIGYVRPHAARLLSTFAERTKVGLPRALENSLDEFCTLKKDEGEFIYLPRFSAWRQMFGENFLLRPMIRNALYRKSVVDDFVHHAFGGIEFEISGTEAANESLCLEDLMRLKVLQKKIRRARDLRLKLGWEFARQLGTLPPSPTRTKLQLHRSLAEDLRATYQEDARAMDRAFFDGKPLMETELQRAVETAVDQPQSTEPEDYFTASELRSLEVMSKIISGLLENKEVNWPAFLHQKRIRDAAPIRETSDS